MVGVVSNGVASIENVEVRWGENVYVTAGL